MTVLMKGNIISFVPFFKCHLDKNEGGIMKRQNTALLSKNYEWYIKADTQKYAGEWIAIVEQKVVASGNDAEKVYRQAKAMYPKKKPSIAKVPSKEILVLRTET
jgi:hypothetical protein